MAISKVILDDETLLDVTNATITADRVLSGFVGKGADGVDVTGSYVPPSTVSRAVPSVSVNSSTGLVTATSTQAAGVVTAGTETGTLQLTTQAAQTITPSTSSQTAVAAGRFTTGAVTVGAIPSQYIVPSGTIPITQNGTVDVTQYASASVEVPTGGGARYPTFTVGPNETLTCDMTYAECLALITTDPDDEEEYAVAAFQFEADGTTFTYGMAGQIVGLTGTLRYVGTQDGIPGYQVDYASDGTLTSTYPPSSLTTLTATSNGTYTPTYGTVYTEVTVNVPGGGGSADDFKAVIEGTTATPTLPGNLTSIRAYAFYYYSALALTELPSGVTSIGEYAFSNCLNLALTELPSGVTSIGRNAFYSCRNLALTELPSGITTIAQEAFRECYELDLAELPSGVVQIGSSAFRTCTSLTLTSLPSTVRYIESSAFATCTSLTSISCEGTITTMGANAFTGTSTYRMQLASASFPNMAITSGFGTVFGSTTAANACQQLEFCDIGSTTGIAVNAFANCYKLQTLVLRRTGAICSLSNVSAFLNTPMRGYNSLTGTVYVPSALISSYQTATNWSTLYNDGTVTFVAIEGSQHEL